MIIQIICPSSNCDIDIKCKLLSDNCSVDENVVTFLTIEK